MLYYACCTSTYLHAGKWVLALADDRPLDKFIEQEFTVRCMRSRSFGTGLTPATSATGLSGVTISALSMYPRTSADRGVNGYGSSAVEGVALPTPAQPRANKQTTMLAATGFS